jgi:hypothetical protein
MDARALNRRSALELVAASREVHGICLTVILNQVFLAAKGTSCGAFMFAALR